MIKATVDMNAIAIMCLGRSLNRSEEKQQANTMTRATISRFSGSVHAFKAKKNTIAFSQIGIVIYTPVSMLALAVGQ